jgi:hypothetical protein
MFLTMVLYYCDPFFELNPSSLCFVITTFRGMALPSLSGEPKLLGPIDRASFYRCLAQSIGPNSLGSPDDEGRAIPRNVVLTKHKSRWIKSKE